MGNGCRVAYGQLRDGLDRDRPGVASDHENGDEAQIQRVVEIVRDARKRLYRILGED